MKKYKNKIIILFLMIIGTIMSYYGFTFAKYVSNSVWDYHLQSKGFYLSSEELGSTVVKNVNNLWDEGSVYFTLKNSLNESVATGYDINYSVSCEVVGDAATDTECRMNGTGTSSTTGTLSASQVCLNTTGDMVDVSGYDKTTCELGGYQWINEVTTANLYFDVVATTGGYEISDVIVDVTASSTSPYTKTLLGRFTLHVDETSDDAVLLEYDNYSDYDRLVVTNTYSTSKCVTIYWDSANLRIDAETSEFSNYTSDVNGYINQIEFTVGATDTLDYIFYKTDFTQTYDVSDFTIIESCGT